MLHGFGSFLFLLDIKLNIKINDIKIKLGKSDLIDSR